MAPSLHERSVEERIPYETSVVKVFNPVQSVQPLWELL